MSVSFFCLRLVNRERTLHRRDPVRTQVCDAMVNRHGVRTDVALNLKRLEKLTGETPTRTALPLPRR